MKLKQSMSNDGCSTNYSKLVSYMVFLDFILVTMLATVYGTLVATVVSNVKISDIL